MIKAKTINGSVLLGIDRENIKRLQDNKPIRVKGSELGIDHDIFIVYGETLDDIAKEFNLPAIN